MFANLSSSTIRLPRMPGVIVLARDLKTLGGRLISLAKKLAKH